MGKETDQHQAEKMHIAGIEKFRFLYGNDYTYSPNQRSGMDGIRRFGRNFRNSLDSSAFAFQAGPVIEPEEILQILNGGKRSPGSGQVRLEDP